MLKLLYIYTPFLRVNTASNSSELLFENDFGSVQQCNKSHKIILTFGKLATRFSLPCFLELKKKVDAINLEQMAEDISVAGDVVIISPCGCERVFLLDMTQVFQIKELLAGAKTMISLNSILYERLYAQFV